MSSPYCLDETLCINFDDKCNHFNDRLINMLTVVYYVGPQSAAEKEYRALASGFWFSLVQQIPNTVSDTEAVCKGKRPMGGA